MVKRWLNEFRPLGILSGWLPNIKASLEDGQLRVCFHFHFTYTYKL